MQRGRMEPRSQQGRCFHASLAGEDSNGAKAGYASLFEQRRGLGGGGGSRPVAVGDNFGRSLEVMLLA